MERKPSAGRPWYHPYRILLRLVIYSLGLYLLTCGFLFYMQKAMTYPGANIPMAPDRAYLEAKWVGFVPWNHPTPGADSPQGYVRSDFEKAAPRGTIVYFHGNGETAWDRPDYAEAWERRGFRCFLYEYPGYGGRPGKPSEAAIVPDAKAVIRSLDQAGYGPIYVWGMSLGTGVAAAVCGDPSVPVHGLALLMPFDSLPNVGLSMFPYIPVRQLMTDQYDSIDNLQHFAHPICVIRGDRDIVIPSNLTLNLFAHLPDPKKIILESGYGHGDWPSSPELSWWDEALDFIAPKKL